MSRRTRNQPWVVTGFVGSEPLLHVLLQQMGDEVFALGRDMLEGGVVEVVLALDHIPNDLQFVSPGEWDLSRQQNVHYNPH